MKYIPTETINILAACPNCEGLDFDSIWVIEDMNTQVGHTDIVCKNCGNRCPQHKAESDPRVRDQMKTIYRLIREVNSISKR